MYGSPLDSRLRGNDCFNCHAGVGRHPVSWLSTIHSDEICSRSEAREGVFRCCGMDEGHDGTTPHEEPTSHWGAGCGESRTSGSEGADGKVPAEQASNSPVAYPTKTRASGECWFMAYFHG